MLNPWPYFIYSFPISKRRWMQHSETLFIIHVQRLHLSAAVVCVIIPLFGQIMNLKQLKVAYILIINCGCSWECSSEKYVKMALEEMLFIFMTRVHILTASRTKQQCFFGSCWILGYAKRGLTSPTMCVIAKTAKTLPRTAIRFREQRKSVYDLWSFLVLLNLIKEN